MTALKELIQEVLGTSVCTSCGTCVNLCPNIVTIDDRVATLGECDLEKGRCYNYCPRTELPAGFEAQLFGDMGYGGSVGYYLQTHVGRSKLKTGDEKFQSGGVVTALLLQALNEGRVNQCIVMENRDGVPKPVTVSTKEEILKAAGSKFAIAPTNMEVNSALKNPANKIGVVTLPCQATGLRKRQLLRTDDGPVEGELQLIIGLFCNWALSQKGWQQLTQKYVGNTRILRVDIPPPPAQMINIKTEKQIISVPLEEVKQGIRPACKACLDMTAENADIAVGMMEDGEGFNTVIVRTEVGRDLLASCLREGSVELDRMSDQSWEHLQQASLNKKTRAIEVACNSKYELSYLKRLATMKENLGSEKEQE